MPETIEPGQEQEWQSLEEIAEALRADQIDPKPMLRKLATEGSAQYIGDGFIVTRGPDDRYRLSSNEQREAA